MKFHFYFKYFILGLIIILAINYNTFLTNNSSTSISTNQESFLTVETGSIKKSIEVFGDAQLVDEQSLTFNKAGTISKVYFKAGDNVKKGDIIAEIDNSDAYLSIDDAEINLENAKLNLQQLYDGADESQILSSKNSINTAESNLEIANKELENLKISQKNSLDQMLKDIENSKKQLESDKSSLELTKQDLELTIKEQDNSLNNTISNKDKSIQDIEDNLKSYINDTEKIIEDSDIIMGVTEDNKDKNDSYDNFLGAKDRETKNNAKNSIIESISIYDNVKIELDSYDYSGEKEKLIKLLNSFNNLYESLYNTTDLIYKTADASIESMGALSESDINSIKSEMSSYRSNSLNKISSIKSSINTLNTLTDVDLTVESNKNSIESKKESIKSHELSIEKQESSIENAIKNYEETVSSYKINLESKQNDLESKKNSLEIAKLNYKELLEGPTDENVKKVNNSIKQAEIKLQSAYESLDDYKLEAPFDGIIRKIDYQVGDNLTNDTGKYIYIENPNLLELSIYLDQIDIVGVNILDDAIVTFDTYSTIPVKAKVSSIDTTPVQSSGVVSYEVKVILDDPTFDKTILSGFTANIEIITMSKENVLLLKTSAINEKDGKYYVNLVENNQTIEKEVEIGIASDGMTEIVSGLKSGDKISIKEFSISSDTTTNSNTSLFSPGSRNSSNSNSSRNFGPPGGF